ncbi:MAG TPA: VanW family protein [Actinomycetes bacterium]|nr:VanW family protein [Actinomycetes bacterium]
MLRPLTSRASGLSARTRVLLVLGGAVGVVVVGYLAAYVLAGPGIARGTTVLGVSIGGLTREEATRTLTRELRDEARAPVPVRAGSEARSVQPAAAGLSLDVEATVDAAGARSWNPADLLDALVGGDDVPPVVAVDRAALAARLDRLADRVDRAPVEGAVRIKGTEVRPVTPVDGLRVQRRAAADAVADGYLDPDRTGPVELPTRVRRPAIGQQAVDRAVAEVAQPAVSAPVALTVEGTTVQLPPEAIGAALVLEPRDGELAPRLRGERLHAAVADELAPIEDPARDASFDIVDGTPQVVPSQQGREVLPPSLAAAVLPVITETGPARAATVALEVSEPEVSTELAQSLGVVEKVAEYTTYYPSDFPGRLTNIHRAADLMDKTLVLPGDVFSFNDTVGERTAERGFAAGFIIEDGRLEVDFGGGVSQLATTTFNAAFFAGLDIVEHNPHSFYISRYPEGRESTIAWGVKDLRFRNDSDHGVFVTTSWTDSSVTVQVWGTKRYRVESVTSERYDVKPFEVVYDPRPPGVEPGTCVATEGVPGFRVRVTRELYEPGRSGALVDSELFRTKYDPEHEVVCGTSGPSEG